MPRRVFITVGEVSGDQHAARLIESLRQLEPDILIEAHGGPEMRRAGATIHREMTGKAAMSVQGAFRALEVYRLLQWTRRYFQEHPPDLHICVDSSAMNLPFAGMAHKLGIPVLYYIAPQLWASREGRMAKVRQWVDRVAVILPFEEEYYARHGVRASFVGHPLFDSLPRDRSRPPGKRFPDAPPVVSIVPGSRRSEVRANLPPLLEVARQIRGAFPGATFLIPTTPAVHQIAVDLSAGFPGLEIELAGFDQMMLRSDLCLCKSGTSTLHVAAFGVPMIVVYRITPIFLSRIIGWFAHRVIRTDRVALVNILTGNIDLVPEFFPWYGNVQPVAEIALDWLRNPERLAMQRAKLSELIAPLDHPGASMNTARIAIELMNSTAAGPSAQDEEKDFTAETRR